MIVTNRMLSILNYVMHSSVRLHINDLANLYAVSHRVIYYDLEMLQELLRQSGCPVELSVENGVVSCEGKSADWRADLRRVIEGQCGNVLYTPEERQEHILWRLLCGHPVRLAALMEELDVSKTTISNDLEVLKKGTGAFRVTLNATTASGFRLSGDETHVCLYAQAMLLQLMEANNVVGRLHAERLLEMQRPYCFYQSGGVSYQQVERIAGRVLHERGFAYRMAGNCALMALICLLRPGQDHAPGAKAEKLLVGTEAAAAAQEMAEKIDELLDPTRERPALFWPLALALLGAGSDYENALYLNRHIDWRVLAANFASEVCAKFRGEVTPRLISFIRDELFQIFLGCEEPLRVWDDHIVLSLRTEYAGLYDIVKQKSEVLAQAFGRPLTERQLVDLMMGFLELYEKSEPQVSHKPKVLVVCNSGSVVSRLMSSKLQLFLDIEVVDTISAFEAPEYVREQQVDYIVTTVPLVRETVPCMFVNALLTEADLKNLWSVFPQRKVRCADAQSKEGGNSAFLNRMAYLSEVEHAVGEHKVPGEPLCLTDLVEPENILLDAAFDSLVDAVRAGCVMLEKSGHTEAEYTRTVEQAVEHSARFMFIGPDMIMPHSIAGRYVKKTGISIVRLKTPLSLENSGAQVRWILTLCTVSKTSHLNALVQLAHLIGSEQAMAAMERAATKQELLTLLQEAE